jgi:hypothetical protein
VQVTGSVIKVSIVPLPLSSEKSRIVKAGIKIANNQGKFTKNSLSSALFAKKKNEKSMKPETIKKAQVTM